MIAAGFISLVVDPAFTASEPISLDFDADLAFVAGLAFSVSLVSSASKTSMCGIDGGWR